MGEEEGGEDEDEDEGKEEEEVERRRLLRSAHVERCRTRRSAGERVSVQFYMCITGRG